MTASTTRIVLRGGWILGEDGATGEPQDVLLVDGLIAQLGGDIDAAGAEEIDCAGSTVMPGLIDGHVHLAMAGAAEPDTSHEETLARVAANARDLLLAGVTTARDVSGPAAALLHQRGLCATDPTAGPQMLVCCEGIATIGGHGTEFQGASTIVTEIDGPEAGRAAVRQRKEIGADWIKVMLNGADDKTELSEDELHAIVDEARIQQIPVAAHASNTAAVNLAVACGVDSIEHGQGIDDALAAEMARKGMAVVSTTWIFRVGAGCSHGPGPNPIDAFDPELQEKVRGIMAIRVADHATMVPALTKADVPLIMGTDSVIGPIGTAAYELEALHELGMSKQQALVAGTVAGARLLGLDDRGRVAEGLRADLLVVQGRPDQDLETMKKPAVVIRGGVVVS